MAGDDVGTDALEDAFDAYLDAALRGDAEPPEDFLARHPAASEALRTRVRAIHAELNAARASSEPQDEERRIGEFRLLRRLGEGGMGVVWEAEQESLGRRVALKVLRADLDASPEAVERFTREARTLAQLDHPGIVRVIAAGEQDGVRYLAMELAEGEGLDALLAGAGGPIDTPRVLRWGAQIARALACAHERGVVHRDVKPSNVLITADDHAMLLDFGIARASAGSLPTLTGPFVGSPAYAPPEQLTGDRVDGRADVYALGATLYQCLTGSPAFDGATVDQVIHQVLHRTPPPPSEHTAGLSGDVDVVLGTALAKRPERRYGTAAAFADDLEALLAFRPIAARPPGVIARVRERARRHPALAATIATVAVGLLAVAGVVAGQTIAAERQRRADARDAVAEARARFDAYETRRSGTADLEAEVLWQRSLLESQYLDDDELARLDAQEHRLVEIRRERETVFHEVLALLRRAEGLDADVVGAARLRAAVFAEKHGEALARKDTRSAAFYADLVQSAEPGGPYADTVRGTGWLDVTTEPPGLDVHVFRYVELSDLVDGGERRLVPVPLRGLADGVVPGELAARPVDGGGGDERPTAAALHLGDRSRTGTAPIPALELARGAYLAVAARDGCIVARHLFRIDPGRDTRVLLAAPDRRVPGCVLVPEPAEDEGGGPYWIAEREVTCGEYLEFLNDPVTRAEIDASAGPIRFPRAPENVADGGYWPREIDGSFRLPDDWRPDWPALGVSWDDAVAYARWRSERDREHVYRLPTLGEALGAAGEPHRRFAFGFHFRPRFASACFSTPRPAPEPVMSYPVDESPYGAYDLVGSAAEWCDAWYDESRGLRRANWGSWAFGKSERFHIWAATGLPPDGADGTTGFRLVVEPR